MYHLEFTIPDKGPPILSTRGVRNFLELQGLIRVLSEVALEAHGLFGPPEEKPPGLPPEEEKRVELPRANVPREL